MFSEGVAAPSVPVKCGFLGITPVGRCSPVGRLCSGSSCGSNSHGKIAVFEGLSETDQWIVRLRCFHADFLPRSCNPEPFDGCEVFSLLTPPLFFPSCQMSVRRFRRRPSPNGSTPSCPGSDVASPTFTWTCGTDACSSSCWKCCRGNDW